MRYLSVCSGIEAATIAWEPLGWVPVAFAEIEKFPAAVLTHHWPHVPNLGDMAKINGADYRGLIDVLVGGTPCQSFSVAGLRGGLDDERGNLALEFVRIADESDPAFVIWENVPGIFSDRGNAFGCFLAALAGEDAPLLPPGGRWTNAGYVLGPRRAIAWRVLDAQYFGLAQRRKRVFLIGCPRNGADPREILFEFDGLRWDSPPSREARADLAGTLESSLGRSRGAGTSPGAITEVCGTLTNISGTRGWSVNAEQAASGHLQLSHWEGGPHPCLNQSAKGSGGIGMSDQEIFSKQGAGLVPHGYVPEIVNQAISCKWSKGTSGPAGDEHHNLIATALRGEGFDASEDGTGRQNLVVTPINTQVGLRHKALGERTGLGVGAPGDPAFTLQGAHSHAVCVAPPLTGNQYGDHESREGLLVPIQSGTVLAFDTTQITSPHNHSNPRPGDPCHPVSARAHPPAIAFHGSQDPDVSGDVTHPLGTNQGQEVCVMQGRWRGDDGRGYDRPPHVTHLPSLDTCKVDIVASVSLRGREGVGTAELSGDVPTPLRSSQGGGDKPHVLAKSAVRRLTPVECARLQGFPDNYTLIEWGKRPAEKCPDGPQYKAYGNSMATKVMKWIGERIERYLFAQQKRCPKWCPCSSANIPIDHGSQGCFETQQYYRRYRSGGMQ